MHSTAQTQKSSKESERTFWWICAWVQNVANNIAHELRPKNGSNKQQLNQYYIIECWCISEIRTKTHCILSVDREKSMELWISNDHFSFIERHFHLTTVIHTGKSAIFFRVCHAERVYFTIFFLFGSLMKNEIKIKNTEIVSTAVM